MSGDEEAKATGPARSRVEGKTFAGDAAEFAFKWFKRSRAALVVELPARNPHGYGGGDGGDGQPSLDQYCAAAENSMLDECLAALTAAGITVKEGV